MGKRKRDGELVEGATANIPSDDIRVDFAAKRGTTATQTEATTSITVQIVTGSYDKTLHGITAKITRIGGEIPENGSVIEFADTFLFNAHSAAIRCLAVSPPSKQKKVVLASGSSDQVINLYHLSAQISSPENNPVPSTPTLVGRKTAENPRNKELGCLQHHNAGVNVLHFPSRSKLLTGADDNTIAVCRTRDWTVLSTIKVPIPKPQGRPSGDTAPLGGNPTGINAFAIHPSMKLMVSVSKREKCMRLWNLLTGKRAGVLNFGKEVLQDLGEGKRTHGEGLKVEWNDVGEEFVVCFERGAIIYGLDSNPKAILRLSPPIKLHQIRYITAAGHPGNRSSILAVSTEDGRIVFFSTATSITKDSQSNEGTPQCQIIGQVSGVGERGQSRIKDFEIIQLPTSETSDNNLLLFTGSSDGSIQSWTVAAKELTRDGKTLESGVTNGNPKHEEGQQGGSIRQLGRLLGVYETGSRITCLKAFLMLDANNSVKDLEVDNGIANGSSKVNVSDDDNKSDS